jgi:hypothetical protein
MAEELDQQGTPDQTPQEPAVDTNTTTDSDNQGNLEPSTKVLTGTDGFPAGTLIYMADGTEKKIEDIELGDIVYGYNVAAKENIQHEVTEFVKPFNDFFIKYTFTNSTTLTCTKSQPLVSANLEILSYSPEEADTKHDYRGRHIGKLEEGTKVVAKDGEAEIAKIEELPNASTLTFNLAIEGSHNFFANGILVSDKK